MAKKVINMFHMMDDYECMWNGIEDLYMEKSGEKIPSFFFFTLAGVGNFIYQKEQKRVAWSDGNTPKMYNSMCDIIGFKYQQTSHKSFTQALSLAKEQIDLGKPVVLGCLDMYYLPYYHALYRKFHTPIHYNLMVGYDDENECIYVHECGVEGVQKLTYKEVEEALNIKESQLSGKNGVCLVEINDKPKKVLEIAKAGYEKKALLQLSPSNSFEGIPAMRKLATEIDNWKNEYSDGEYFQLLRNIIMFTGTVPKFPNRLIGVPFPDNIRFMAAYEKLSNALKELSQKYEVPDWEKAALQFYKCGELIETLSSQMTDCVIANIKLPNGMGKFINEIADEEETAYKHLLSGSRSR